MDLTLTKDKQTIKYVLLALWDSISPDGAAKEELDSFLEKAIATDFFIKVTKEDKLGGVIHFNKIDDVTYEIHMNMLPGFRGEFAKAAADKAIALVQNLTGFKILQATVPDLFPNVRKFTEAYGMQPVRRVEHSWDKNGIKYQGTLYQMEIV